MAGTLFVTFKTINSLRAKPCFAALSSISWFAETSTTNMVAFPTIHTLAGLGTPYSVSPHRTLILASVRKTNKQKLGLLPINYSSVGFKGNRVYEEFLIQV